MIVIRDSAIDRLGVFTTRQIKKGEYVCGYGDQIVDSASSYAMQFPDGTFRGGARPTGADADSVHMCGFMMNDANNISIIHTDTDRLTLPNLRAAVNAYIYDSLQNSNVAFLGNNGNLHARRNIDANEELFLHYGHDYWLSRLLNGSVYPYVRFLCLVELVNREPTGGDRRSGLMDALRDPESASSFVRNFLLMHSRGDDLAFLRGMYKSALLGGA